jgi:hypothetical protein
MEFKAGQTVAGDWFNALRKYEALHSMTSDVDAPTHPSAPIPRPLLVYGGQQPLVCAVPQTSCRGNSGPPTSPPCFNPRQHRKAPARRDHPSYSPEY